MEASINKDLPTNSNIATATMAPTIPNPRILLFFALNSISRNITINKPGNTKPIPRKSTDANKSPNKPPIKSAHHPKGIIKPRYMEVEPFFIHIIGQLRRYINCKAFITHPGNGRKPFPPHIHISL